MRRPRTLAGEVMKAGEKALRAGKKVAAAESTLALARKAQVRADARYLELVRQTFGGPALAGREEGSQATA